MCDELHFGLLLGKEARKCTCRHLHTKKMWAEGSGEGWGEREVAQEEVWQWDNCYQHKKSFAGVINFLSSLIHMPNQHDFLPPTLYISLCRCACFYENFLYDVVTLSKKNEWWFILLKCSVVWLLWTATQMCVFQWAFCRLWSSSKIGRGRKSFYFLFGCTGSLLLHVGFP